MSSPHSVDIRHRDRALRGFSVILLFLMAGALLLYALLSPMSAHAAAPNAPTALSANAGDSEAHLSWTAPDGAETVTGYEYRHSIDSGSTWDPDWISTGNGTATNYTVSGLTNAVTYTFQVRAVNDDGPSDASNATDAVPFGPPYAVTELSGTGGDGYIDLSWNAPSSGSPPTGYEYRRSSDGGTTWDSEWTSTGNGSATGLRVSGLTNNVEYSFEVRAVNNAGPSSSAGNWSGTPHGPPYAVTGLSGTGGDGYIDLSWNAPSSGDPPTGYESRQSTDNGVTWDLNWHTTGNDAATGQHVPGLINGIEYTFEIRGVNAFGTGPSETWTGSPYGPPEAISNLEGVAGDGQVELSWTAPSSGTPPTGYEFQRSSDGGTTWDPGWTSTGNGAVASYTVSGLTNNVGYLIEVRAVNNAGPSISTGSWSGTPHGPPYAVTGLTGQAGVGFVVLSWTAPSSGDPPTGYEYRQSADGGNAWGQWTSTGTGTDAYVSGLTGGVEYTFQVRGVNDYGAGSPSGAWSGTPDGSPMAPTGLTATGGDGYVDLTWTAPSSGIPPTGYEYRWSSDDGDSWYWTWSSTGNGAATSTRVSDLENSVTYLFQVRANNEHGAGGASNTASATTFGPPEAVNILDATPGNGYVELTWGASHLGSPPTGYEYRLSSDDGNTWGQWTDAGTATSVRISGLSNGTEYLFQIRGVNSAGAGEPSYSWSQTPVGPPLAPTGLTGRVGDSQVTLSWTAPSSGYFPTTYQYRQSSDGGSTWGQWIGTGNSNRTTATVSGLTNGVEYTFQVRAVNKGGASASTASWSGTPLASLLRVNDLGLHERLPSGKVSLTWSDPEDDGQQINKYQYRYRQDGDSWQAWADAVTVTPDGCPNEACTYEISGLTDGVEYAFQVRAITSSTEGPPSNTLIYTPNPLPTTDIGTGYYEGKLAISWRGNPDANRYRYNRNSAPQGEWQAIPTVVSGGNGSYSFTVPGTFDGGATYVFQIGQTNNNGGVFYREADVDTPADTTDLRATVNGAESPVSNDGEVDLAWDAVAARYAIQFYLNYRLLDGDQWTGWQAIPDSWHNSVNRSSYTVTGLQPGESYLFQVYATNSIGPGAFSQEVSHNPMPPSAVSGLTAARSGGMATLNWSAARHRGTPITKHQYRTRETEGSYGPWTDIPNSAPGGANYLSYTVTGLDADTKYVFQVRAVNRKGSGPASAEADVAAPPSQVASLTADPGVSAAYLFWPIDPNDDRDIQKFQYRQKSGSLDYGEWTDIPASGNSWHRVAGLTNGAQYTFQVRAVNDVGAGPASPSASATPKSVAQPPQFYLSTSSGWASLEVQLGYEMRGGEQPNYTALQYRMRTGGTAYGDWTAIPDSAPTGENSEGYVLTGLTETEHTFQLRAVNDGIVGTPSDENAVTVYKLPGQITDLAATRGDGQVELTWTIPTGPDFLSPDFLQVRVRGSDSQSQVIAVPDSGPTGANRSGYIVSGLENGATYSFVIWGVTQGQIVGVGPESNEVEAMPAAVPGPVERLLAVAGDGQVELTWELPIATVISSGPVLDDGGEPITGVEYRWKIGREEYGPWQTIWTRGVDEEDIDILQEYVATGLTNGVYYTFQVRLANVVGHSAASDEVKVRPITDYPALEAISDLAATGGYRQATLTWNVPSADLASITGFDFRFHYDEGGRTISSGWIPMSEGSFTAESGTARSYTVTDLINGKTYTFEVRSVNPEGAGPASNRAAAALSGRPHPVINLAVEDPWGNGSAVFLNWTAPIPSSPAVDKYQYRQNSGQWTDIPNEKLQIVGGSLAPHVTYELTGMTHGSHTFQVRTVNQAGESEPSETVVIVLQEVVPDTVYLNHLIGGNAQVTLEWSVPNPGTAPITQFQYRYAKVDPNTLQPAPYGAWLTVPGSASHETGAERSYIVGGLQNAATYVFQMRAVNSAGAGPEGPGDQATTDREVAPPITDLEAVNLGDGQTSLLWTIPHTNVNIYNLEYRVKAVEGHYGWWRSIPDSGQRGQNREEHRVTLECGDYYFQVRSGTVAAGNPVVSHVSNEALAQVRNVNHAEDPTCADDYVPPTVTTPSPTLALVKDIDVTIVFSEPVCRFTVDQQPAGNAGNTRHSFSVTPGSADEMAKQIGAFLSKYDNNCVASNSPATGAPTVTGTAQVGETLTADTSGIADDDGIANAVFSYQWLADGANIAGATASSYTLTASDAGKNIRVRVSFTDDAGNAESLTSAATDAVSVTSQQQVANTQATGQPVIRGTVQVGETLTVDVSGISDDDGMSNAVFSYLWFANGADIIEARSSTYTLVESNQGQTMRVKVSFNDDAGNEEIFLSSATMAVAPAPTDEPLTASFSNGPSSHDGESDFTFELHFSEQFSVSFRTLRNQAFEVTGGTVRKAQRLEQGSNVGWRITVRPNSNSDVTIVLPETTDCADDGAICTGDGRMLSNRSELTVSGP